MVRELELAGPVLHRSAEGAPLEPEQLGLETSAGRPVQFTFTKAGRSGAIRVERAGDQLLAACRSRRRSAPGGRCRPHDRSARGCGPCARCGRRAVYAGPRPAASRRWATSRPSWRRRSARGAASRSDSSKGVLAKSIAPSFMAGRQWPCGLGRKHENRHGAGSSETLQASEPVHVTRHHEIQNHRGRRRKLEASTASRPSARIGLVSAATRKSIRNSHMAGSSSTTMTRMD